MRAGRATAAEGSGLPPLGGSSSSTLESLRAPSTRTPDVVVIDRLPDEMTRKEVLDPAEDLWLSTADGRYNSPMIPLRVGEAPYMQTFYVHKHVLIKAEYFKKALCGEFREREAQSMDLPEEDPAIFHFLIAFLYEGRYVPIKPIASALIPDVDKGKGKDPSTSALDSDSDSTGSLASDSSARSRRQRTRRRRHADRHFERMRQKHPGLHRPGCNCPQCLAAGGPPCWHCAAPRVPPPPGLMHPPPPGAIPVAAASRHHRRHGVRNAAAAVPPPPPGSAALDALGGGLERIRGEDMRTWLLAYELNLDVYICANKFLMDDFKREVARACVDMLETAGADAARPEVLHLCTKLYHGLSEHDALLKMIFARVGFLQPALWARASEETGAFLVGNPEVAALMLRETASRRQEDLGGRQLPSMERPWYPSMMGAADGPYMPHHRAPRW